MLVGQVVKYLLVAGRIKDSGSLMTCWQGNCAGWPDNGQHYAKDMLVDGRTLALLAYGRIINEGHVGGWPNNGQSFSEDMLLAGRTMASAFRRICWWLAKGGRQK